MTAGLQVWDASGNLMVDTSTLMGRIFGSVTIQSGDSGSLVDENLLTGVPFAIPCAQFLDGYDPFEWDPGISNPVITFSGNTMFWSSYNTSLLEKPEYIIYYGAY